MAKNLYIDASHPSETRVVLKANDNIDCGNDNDDAMVLMLMN